MIFIILPILAIIYLGSLPVITKRKFGIRAARTFRIIALTATSLLVIILTAETYNIQPGSYWTSKVLFWFDVFSCLAAYGLCRKDAYGKGERTIYKFIFFSPLILLVFLLIPFIGIGTAALFYVKFIGDEKFILFNDGNIRIEQPYIRFMGPDPQPVIYRKKNLISYRDTVLPIGYNEERDKIQVKQKGDSAYLITLISPDNWQVPTGTQTFYYRLNK